jgi:hypothetical protein
MKELDSIGAFFTRFLTHRNMQASDLYPFTATGRVDAVRLAQLERLVIEGSHDLVSVKSARNGLQAAWGIPLRPTKEYGTQRALNRIAAGTHTLADVNHLESVALHAPDDNLEAVIDARKFIRDELTQRNIWFPDIDPRVPGGGIDADRLAALEVIVNEYLGTHPDSGARTGLEILLEMNLAPLSSNGG